MPSSGYDSIARLSSWELESEVLSAKLKMSVMFPQSFDGTLLAWPPRLGFIRAVLSRKLYKWKLADDKIQRRSTARQLRILNIMGSAFSTNYDPSVHKQDCMLSSSSIVVLSTLTIFLFREWRHISDAQRLHDHGRLPPASKTMEEHHQSTPRRLHAYGDKKAKHKLTTARKNSSPLCYLCRGQVLRFSSLLLSK